MRKATIIVSLVALLMSYISPALGSTGKREGVPGRRAGGGTRWTAPQAKPAVSMRNRLTALSFASRNNLPVKLKVKALFG